MGSMHIPPRNRHRERDMMGDFASEKTLYCRRPAGREIARSLPGKSSTMFDTLEHDSTANHAAGRSCPDTPPAIDTLSLL